MEDAQREVVRVRSDPNDSSDSFRAEMLRYIETQRGRWHYGQELQELGQAKAQRLIAEALRAEGITAEHLAIWRKGHPFKVRLAVKLRQETTANAAWIAEHLGMGSRGHLMHLLQSYRKGAEDQASQQRMLQI